MCIRDRDSTVAGASSTVPLCGTSSTTNRVSTVKYLAGSSSCCDVELTLAQLEAACGTNLTSTSNQHVATGTYIGQWGGSAYENVADWIAMPDTVVPDFAQFYNDSLLTPYWDADALTCYGIYHGSERLQLAYAYQGPLENPQGRILAARQIWEPQTFAWSDLSSAGLTGTQRFPVCYTVSWEQQSVVEDRAKAIDGDVFYFLFINEDWGLPLAGQNYVIIVFTAFAIVGFGTYLFRFSEGLHRVTVLDYH
eukprot:TRINITY_DN10590_c0_g3_i2.p1 TRINITY_DN10590_c0_g3~~TRINITY_DN10590_c0_g3_i2.p1  ORF type:complete len:251 (+),score=53.65 TRINITY_DN10590_c0_g3_i2:65-817(+)